MAHAKQILTIGRDHALADECELALASIGGLRAVTSAARGHSQGVEAARSRRPDIVIIELADDLDQMPDLVEELLRASPESVIAAAYHPHFFDADSATGSAAMIGVLRAGARDFLRRPLSTDDLQQLIFRVSRDGTAPTRPLGKTILFASNKGGVGKSTLAVNTACGLARKHRGQVLLIDTSLQMGVCGTLLDLQPQSTLTDAIRERQRLDEVLLRQLTVPHPCGLDLLAAPSDVLQAAEMDEEGMTRVLQLARRTYDFVIVDTFPVLDAMVMAMLDLADRTYLVFENLVPTLIGAVKFLALLESLQVDKERQRIILNKYQEGSGCLQRQVVESRLNRPVDHVIPNDRRAMLAANIGQPFALHASRWNKLGRSILRLIDDVESLSHEAGAPTGNNGNGPTNGSTAKGWSDAGHNGSTTTGQQAREDATI